MYGLSVVGKTYNPNTYEISLFTVTGKVIDIISCGIRYWPNGSSDSITLTVDALACALWDGTQFTSETVIIPFFLLESVSGATVDNSYFSYVEGKETIFNAPHLIFIDKDRDHELTALEDNTIACCIHGVRDDSGDIVDAAWIPNK